MKQIQSIVRTVLYYSRAIDRPALPALNDIGTQQSTPTQAMIADTEWIMDSFHTYPDAHLQFFAGDMQLHVNSDAAYLVMPAAKSCIVGYFFLSADPNPLNYNNAPHNALMLVKCCTLKNVICSAAETECNGLFHNAQNTVTIRSILQALSHPQQATKIKTDNSTVNAFVHAPMRFKRSKTWDMRFHWLREKAVRKA
eukprot:15357882-Ditylum_brightwellii.AAC.1